MLFESLAGVYVDLGFEVLGDQVFRDLVVSRIVEAMSLLDTGRVLTDLGRDPASYMTMRRTLTRAQQRSYRDQIAATCFEHASSSGDVSLILHDVTVRHEALVVRVEVRDLCRIPCRSGGLQLGQPDRGDDRKGGNRPDEVVTRQHRWMACAR